MSGPRVLVVDDEPAVLRTLRANLLARGYDVTAVESGEEALLRSAEQHPDLVILDLMLPGLSGIEVCEALRAGSAVPILVLSARGEEQTKVRALDLGADDYLTKPFGIDELLARVRALLRRGPSTPEGDGTLRVGALTLDLGAREVVHNGARLELTPREFDVLAYLMRHSGKVVTHRVLLQEVWGPEYGRETQYLRVFINRLRRKIEDDPSHPRYIATEPGVGYRLLKPH
ncbi:MAG: response regulator transcription factor [Chloroflexi bacterium]|nr:response regulator transcription factor [Chloroflexota bacterium]